MPSENAQQRQLRHDCAQVERDNLDLHAALADAIRRLTATNHSLDEATLGPEPLTACRAVHAVRIQRVERADLLEVLDRTSRPVT